MTEMVQTVRRVEQPLPPTREQLLMWLQAENTDAPLVFCVNATDTKADAEADLATCPILLWLKRRYGFFQVQADEWRLWKGRGYGVTVVFDADDFPASLNYVRAFEIVDGELDREYNGDYDDLTRDEVIDILKNVENPHDAAHRIINARRLSAAGANGRAVVSG